MTNLEADFDTPKTLDDICEFIVDCLHKTAPTQLTGYPSIRTPNVGRGRLILDGVNRVSEEVYHEWTKRAVPRPGDLILGAGSSRRKRSDHKGRPDGMSRTTHCPPATRSREGQFRFSLLLLVGSSATRPSPRWRNRSNCRAREHARHTPTRRRSIAKPGNTSDTRSDYRDLRRPDRKQSTSDCVAGGGGAAALP